MAYIKGNIKHIIFESDTGFIVGLFRVIDTDLEDYLNKTITFTGTFHELKIENNYILYGDITNHYRYGEQFLVTSYDKVMPESKNGIISFLSSKLFPGVGVRLATKIVETLGDNVLDLIVSDYHHLLLVPNMTDRKAIKITDILKKENASYKIIINLQNMGFGMNEASKIYKYYKESTMDIINDNIYALINDNLNIGFLIIDKIAASLEYIKDDERRLKACIIYVMNDLCITKGNIYNESEDIYLGVSNYLNFNFSIEDFNYYIQKLNQEGKIIIENERYYLKDYYNGEIYISNFISKLLTNKITITDNLDRYIKKLEKEDNLKYNDKQRLAITSSFKENFLIITGGPGTGKTTIIKAIVNIYQKINDLTNEKMNDELILLAPTGRAAKRMMEATGRSAMTIHKFLKWNKETNEFAINEFNKADVKFIIVDEVSMIDHFLLLNLLKGLKPMTKIIFVGDHNQLPSVGPGEILKDLIEVKKITVIELNYLYRQKENSYIITLAHEIREGNVPSDFNETKADYNFIETRKENIKSYIIKLCENALNKGYSYDNIQVLIPMYKGVNGIDAINSVLQDVFNPHDDKKTEFKHNNIIYRIGDKVLQIKNNNDLNISNGDIGIIENITHHDSKYEILINFNDDLIEYDNKDFDDIRLGYAISIHKAQGSEFDIVILPMDLSYNRLLYRKLLYTAVTRAKKSLIIIGDTEAFKRAIINQKEEKRKTSLASRIDFLDV